MADRPLDQFAATLPLEACAELKTNPQGLTAEDAQARLAQFGPNTIGDGLGRAPLAQLFSPFINWITTLLLLAGLLAFVSETPAIGWAIITVALLNGLFTFWQEYQAERAIAALRHLLPAMTFVRRAGQVEQVPTAEIVPGDMLPLKPNTVVAADGYLITGEGLRVKQTMLTGNSALVSKMSGPMPDPTLALTERPNILLAGTLVIEGQGSLLVVTTGMQTQLGEIARSTAALRAEPSPLVRALNQLAAMISRVALVAGLAIFVLTAFVQRLSLNDSIIFAIGMIVAFVPEGLLPTVTLALALARRRLLRHRVLVKRLADVEGMGAATVLCIDRTDVLASDHQAVTAAWAGGQPYSITGSGTAPQGAFRRGQALIDPQREPDLPALLRAAALCNNARLLPPEGGRAEWQLLGSPTEGALLIAAVRGGVDLAAQAEAMFRSQTLPYDARRRLMAVVMTVAGSAGRESVAYVRGMPNAVLPLCTAIRRGGADVPLDAGTRAAVQAAIDGYARAGLRVVALAERQLPPREEEAAWSAEEVERSLTLLGVLAVDEPLQPEVTQLIAGCQRAGLRVLLTTGAYGLTADASARRAGLVRGERSRIVADADLDAMDDTTLDGLLRGDEEVIFAQLDAAAKRRIVARLQVGGDVVAFLGDSINDAPALKQADVGVALSASGTTVALAAADIVLDANHPAGLLLALEEGRAIFSNIQKFSTYIFTHNVAQTVAVVVGVLLGVPLPLMVLQVLAIDLGSELFPSVALSTEPPEPGVLDQPPRQRGAPLITRSVLLQSFAWLGLLEGSLALLAHFMGYWSAGWRLGQPLPSDPAVYAQATTLTYAAIVLAQIGCALTSRTQRASLRQVGLWTNRALLVGMLASVALMLALIYTPPLAETLHLVAPTPQQWLVLLSFPVLMVLAEEGRKAYVRASQQRATPTVRREARG